MFDYAVRELGYSTGAAWRRLKAMRLCAEVQGARTRLQEGTLTLDAAAQLQHAFELDRHDPSLPPRGRRGSLRSAEVAAATSAPKDPAAPHATAVPLTGQPAGAVSSRDATLARRPAAASRTEMRP